VELIDALDRTYQHANRVMAGVRPDQFDAMTPCSEWKVRDLIEHMYGTVVIIGAAAGGRPPDEIQIGPDTAQQFEKATAENLSVWRAPGALDQTITGGAGTMPGRAFAGINLLDIATHSWDLANATGQPAELPVDVATAAWEASQQVVTPELRIGRFAEAIPADNEATVTQQLVAFLGRTP
jgi:uncharacterized protein (TIGR03086 family)